MIELKEHGQYFTPEGREVEYIGKATCVPGLIVRDVYDDGEEQHIGDAYIYEGVLFGNEPAQRMHPDIIAAEKTLASLRQEIKVARVQLDELTPRINDAKAKHESFRTLLDYLDGKITHVVVTCEYSAPAIVALADLLSGRDEYEKWANAVCLFAIPGKKANRYEKPVQWKVNRWYDGSGGWKEFTPCRSEDEAKGIVQGIVDSALAEWRAGGNPRHYLYEIKKVNPWFDVPEDWAEFVEKKRKRSLMDSRTALQAQIAAIDKQMA